MPVFAAELVEFLEKRARQPLTAREILGELDLSRGDRQEAVRLIEELAREGTLVRLKGNRYALPRRVNLAIGTVSIHRDGYGFVAPGDGRPDVFIPARFLREAMHGDRVAVRIEHAGRFGKPEGRVIRVLERVHQTLVGRFEAGRGFGYVVPADPRLSHDILIPKGAAGTARPGQIVVARIDTYPERNRMPEGVIVEVLGEPDDPEVEILAIVHKHGLPNRFPAEVLEAAAQVPDRVRPEDLAGREDLRELPTVTIDGETAKDFDDAVAVRREKGQAIRLWVSIADVGHYVSEGSPVDREAYERGTSVYFPGRCIPMLPENLSNGICSLNPEVERLAMTAEMVFDAQGNRISSRFYPSVIRSRARLTYTEVASVLVERDPAAISRLGGELPVQLETMELLARRLMAMRRRRGSLDFDLPEAEIVLDLRGRPENIVRAERTIAHRVIEEFMLAANEAVASFLVDKGAPLLFRVHEPPDLEKLQAFQEFVGHFNYGFNLSGSRVDPAELQVLLAEVEGRPEERMINQVLLRSMKQACYSPDNSGHFGLAADPYCHFTSPIRRYPDLVVHRVLRQVLTRGQLPPGQKSHLERELPGQGEQTSHRERRAMEAEREIVELKKCQFMAGRVGEQFDGIVSGVQPFGVFVELKEYFVEGLVHISSLTDDFYHFEEDLQRLIGENRRRELQVGSGVRVSVKNVNLERREIDFVLADLPEEGRRRPSPRRKTGRRRRA
ncbi:ribonuclease R [Desulfuromonas versatilis]|uniref:Ribonuclease R n=1 Tax=Desulfuromonas versatilis TaxID=2802975 RepID=A0ABM8HVE4_9BACT|nr:ribonuclease R [Desulfuromonas versatilis]BCR04656.1 ribonuclease R [Desulfuromonas versatilis]